MDFWSDNEISFIFFHRKKQRKQNLRDLLGNFFDYRKHRCLLKNTTHISRWKYNLQKSSIYIASAEFLHIYVFLCLTTHFILSFRSLWLSPSTYVSSGSKNLFPNHLISIFRIVIFKTFCNIWISTWFRDFFDAGELKTDVSEITRNCKSITDFLIDLFFQITTRFKASDRFFAHCKIIQWYAP